MEVIDCPELLRNLILNGIDINNGDYDYSGIEDMSYMFSGHPIKKTPIIDLTNVSNIDGMYKDCEELEFAEDMEGYEITDADKLFMNCRKLKKRPKLKFLNIVNFSDVYHGCVLLGLPDTVSLNSENKTEEVNNNSLSFKEKNGYISFKIESVSDSYRGIFSMNGIFSIQEIIDAEKLVLKDGNKVFFCEICYLDDKEIKVPCTEELFELIFMKMNNINDKKVKKITVN